MVGVPHPISGHVFQLRLETTGRVIRKGDVGTDCSLPSQQEHGQLQPDRQRDVAQDGGRWSGRPRDPWGPGYTSPFVQSNPGSGQRMIVPLRIYPQAAMVFVPWPGWPVLMSKQF